MTSKRLEDRVIVVTGGGQGLGRAISIELAHQGAYVVVADRNQDGATAVASEISKDRQAIAVKLDVSDSNSCRDMAKTVAQSFGHVDGIVNGAAIFSTIQMKPFWEISELDWDSLMSVNLKGPWLVTSALLSLLRESDSGSIVNIGSDSVWEGRGGYLHYISSKAGVQGMSFAMAHELGEFGIRVNTLSPGATKTEIPRATVTPEQLQAMLQARALHRIATPEDIVGVAVFLLSADSSFVTGQTLSVNGGSLHR